MPSRSALEILENKVIKTSSLVNPNITRTITNYTADGAIALTDTVAKLSKTSAGAFTLAAPTSKEEGKMLTIVAGTAYAHVVTATDLINDGVTGGAKDTITMGAFVGSAITLMAVSGTWYVVSKNVATVAAV